MCATTSAPWTSCSTPTTSPRSTAPSRRPRAARLSECCSRARMYNGFFAPIAGRACCRQSSVPTRWWVPYGRSDDLSRQQELLLLVAAPLARAEAHHGGFRRSGDPALPVRQPRDGAEIFAFGAGAGIAPRRADRVGKPGDLRVPRRDLSQFRAIAERPGGARQRPCRQRRDAVLVPR